MLDFANIARATSGKIISNNYHGTINHFLTDSRSIVNPREAVFVAIKGQRHDGHQYIKFVHEKGVKQFIVEEEKDIDEKVLSSSSVLLVQDSIETLQKIASEHRNQFDIPVVGITGSNGKTIVKEWLGQLLEEHFKLVKSPKSYNSQLGVPLSVLQMTDWNNFGVFEAGISTTGEMKKLQKIIRPGIGIFTNIGPAHDEGFSDQNEKAREKWNLFAESEFVIYCFDHKLVRENKPDSIKTLTWGISERADVKLGEVKKHDGYTDLLIKYKGEKQSFRVPFIDDVSLENVMHCISLMMYLNIPSEDFKESLSRLTIIDRRLSLKKGINNCYLIDDSYNNDLVGLQIAIDFMRSQPARKQRIILSDVLQSGLEESTLYTKLNKIFLANGIDELTGIGAGMVRNKSVFQMKATFYDSTDQFLRKANTDNFQDENILIKGARPFEFEKITNFLSEKIHGTVLEINLEALNNNLNFYRSKLKTGVKLMVMVKASAYGSGSHQITSLLQHNRVDYLAVAYPDEGVELRRKGIHLPMMVMNVAPESYANILKYELEPEIYSLVQLRSFVRFLQSKETKLKIHLKLDSGMHRLGFEAPDIKELIPILKENPSLEVVSIYSHLAGADEEIHNEFSESQVNTFLMLANEIEKALGIQPIRHILNSAGIIRFPEYQMDMVRLGIGLYGFEATQQSQEQLQPISTLKTVISQVRKVKKGETIGYGRKGIAEQDSKIATIAIGYADGFSRAFSNGKISLSVNGKMVPVIGNVCMDMTMLDITGISAKEGDEVVIFGEKPTIKELADAIGTIPYEILTNISSRVTRVFYFG